MDRIFRLNDVEDIIYNSYTHIYPLMIFDPSELDNFISISASSTTMPHVRHIDTRIDPERGRAWLAGLFLVFI